MALRLKDVWANLTSVVTTWGGLAPLHAPSKYSNSCGALKLRAYSDLCLLRIIKTTMKLDLSLMTKFKRRFTLTKIISYVTVASMRAHKRNQFYLCLPCGKWNRSGLRDSLTSLLSSCEVCLYAPAAGILSNPEITIKLKFLMNVRKTLGTRRTRVQLENHWAQAANDAGESILAKTRLSNPGQTSAETQNTGTSGSTKRTHVEKRGRDSEIHSFSISDFVHEKAKSTSNCRNNTITFGWLASGKFVFLSGCELGIRQRGHGLGYMVPGLELSFVLAVFGYRILPVWADHWTALVHNLWKMWN